MICITWYINLKKWWKLLLYSKWTWASLNSFLFILNKNCSTFNKANEIFKVFLIKIWVIFLSKKNLLKLFENETDRKTRVYPFNWWLYLLWSRVCHSDGYSQQLVWLDLSFFNELFRWAALFSKYFRQFFEK